MIYRRNWLWFFILVFLPLFLAGCSGIRWQMKETVFFGLRRTLFYRRNSASHFWSSSASVGRGFFREKYTDSTGRVVFQLAPGTYTVDISKDGYSTIRDSITIYTLELTPGIYPYGLIPQGG